MSRPDFITAEDITRYQDRIQQDPWTKQYSDVPLLMEVCYAGFYLGDELEKLGCPDNLNMRICFHAGKLSFGRDPWEVHQKLLEDYKSDTLEYEAEPSEWN